MSFVITVSLEKIPLDISFDYAVRADGWRFVMILGIRHKNEEIFPIIDKCALPTICQTIMEELSSKPPSPEDLAANDEIMRPFRESSNNYKKFLAEAPLDKGVFYGRDSSFRMH